MTRTPPEQVPEQRRGSHDERVAGAADTLRLALAGDGRAWRQLVDEFDGLVRATARRYRLQDTDVDDVSQTTWLRLFEHGGSVRDAARLPGWLATTASREALRLLARGKREVVAEAFERESDDPVSDDPAALVLEQELHRGLHEVVATLPQRWQELLLALAAPDRPGYAEVAVTLQLPVGSIGPTRRRALERSRSLLQERELQPCAG